MPIKKFLRISGVIFFIVFWGVYGNSFAQIAESVQAGVAEAVKGEVKTATPPEKTMRPLKSGDKIFMGDKIETGAEGYLKILLLDQTVFTLGPLSAITVDEFVYDPENAGSKASVVKGVFRAVSGKMMQDRAES